MRLNKFLALYGGLSRRSADKATETGRVTINGTVASVGQSVNDSDQVFLDQNPVTVTDQLTTIMLNKPVGYVCSRDGQGNKTVYELLPANMSNLKPVGRLDKDSSGLLLMSNDGDLAYQLTHPKFEKLKRYRVRLNKDLTEDDRRQISTPGVELDDGLSRLGLKLVNNDAREWFITMHQGRNRQIRRTFESLHYRVQGLHRLEFGPYKLGDLASGQFHTVANWTKNRYNVVNE